MKRTPLKRKTPLKAKTGLNRSPMKRTSTKKTAARKAAKGDVRWRSEEYLAWVRTLPCCVCGATGGVAAHHLIGMWGLSGMGLTAPDSYAMPACDPVYGHGRNCHQQIHADKALRAKQPDFLRDTLSRGVRMFEGDIKDELIRTWRDSLVAAPPATVGATSLAVSISFSHQLISISFAKLKFRPPSLCILDIALLVLL